MGETGRAKRKEFTVETFLKVEKGLLGTQRAYILLSVWAENRVHRHTVGEAFSLITVSIKMGSINNFVSNIYSCWNIWRQTGDPVFSILMLLCVARGYSSLKKNSNRSSRKLLRYKCHIYLFYDALHVTYSISKNGVTPKLRISVVVLHNISNWSRDDNISSCKTAITSDSMVDILQPISYFTCNSWMAGLNCPW